MSKVRVDLQSVKVIEGQGVGEGDFELRVTVKEGKHEHTWPSANGSEQVEKDVVRNIGAPIATYDVASGSLTKLFEVSVLEIDKGLLGQSDQGGGTVSLEMTPNMTPLSRTVTIPLKRPDMSFLGKVNVTLSAQRVN